MANPATAPEPSMEEILASIRQIISEDGDGSDKAAAGQANAAAGAAASGPGEKTAAPDTADADKDGSVSGTNGDRDMDARAEADLAKAEDAFASDDETSGDAGDEVGDENAASGDKDAGDDETMSKTFDDPTATGAGDFASEPDSNSDVEESTFMAMPAQSKQQSPAPIDDDKLLSEDSDEVVHGAFSALAHTILAQNARTLEDLISEMLQPMLKGWLDDNLPSLVERLVKEEIDRVSRGRR
jgi:cell pole-organizing protein PopZ